MKNLITYSVLVLLSLGITSSVNNDEFVSDLKLISDAYESLSGVKTELEYVVYEDSLTTNRKDIQKGMIITQDEFLYQKIGPVEMYMNDKYMASINTDQKIISIRKRLQENENEYFIGLDPENLELFSLVSKVNSTSNKGKMKSYNFTYPSDEYSSLTIEFDTKKYYLNKMVMYYKGIMENNPDGTRYKVTPRMELNYLSTTPNYKSMKTRFYADKYLFFKDGEYVLKASYKSYKLFQN